MREPIKILLISIGIVLFSTENVGKAFLYAFCLFCILSKKREVVYLGITSIIFDLYHALFVGITFVSLVISLLVTERFQPILNNVSFAAKAYYLFAILFAAETVNYFLVKLAGGNFDFYFHMVVIIKAILLYSAFEILQEYKYVER